jgi:hypothetical protein
MKRIRMRVHVEGVDREVVCCHFEGLKHLFKREFRAVAEYDNVLYTLRLKNVESGGEGDGLTLGQRFILDLMNRRRCFWFMLLEWWTCVSTLRRL